MYYNKILLHLAELFPIRQKVQQFKTKMILHTAKTVHILWKIVSQCIWKSRKFSPFSHYWRIGIPMHTNKPVCVLNFYENSFDKENLENIILHLFYKSKLSCRVPIIPSQYITKIVPKALIAVTTCSVTHCTSTW